MCWQWEAKVARAWRGEVMEAKDSARWESLWAESSAPARARLAKQEKAGGWLAMRVATGNWSPMEEAVTEAAEAPLDGWKSWWKEAADLHLDDAEAAAAVRLWCGLRVAPPASACMRSITESYAHRRPQAAKVCPADASNEHSLTCPRGPWAGRRHDNLCRLLQGLARAAGVGVVWRPKVAEWPQKGGEDGEPDLECSWGGTQAVMVDLTVTDSEVTRAGAKELKYPTFVGGRRTSARSFVAFVVSHAGGLGRDAEALLAAWAKAFAQSEGMPKGAVLRWWRELFSVRLVKDQVAALRGGW